MFRYFENLIDPFRRHDEGMPPTTLAAFYWHYTRQVWPVLAVLMVVGFFISLIEVSIFRYIGAIVDLLKTTTPERVLADYGWTFLWMGFVVIVARPIVTILHDLLVQQSLAPSFTNLVRWQTHRYVLRQTVALLHRRLCRPHRLEDRADRPGAARIGGAGLRRAVVRHHLRDQFAAALQPARPPPDDPAGDLDRGFRLCAGLVRAAHPRAVGDRVGSALDADRAHRRQLHQHPDGEALRPHRPRGRLRPRRRRRSPAEVPPVDPADHGHVEHGGDHERPAHRRHDGARRVAVGARRSVARRAHHRRRPRIPHRHHVRLDHVDLGRRVRQCRRGAGGHGDHRPAAGAGRQARRGRTRGRRVARSASRTSPSTMAARAGSSRTCR